MDLQLSKMFDFNTQPDAINEIGTKFWVDKSLTKYAREPNSNGIKLENVLVLFAQNVNGVATRLLMVDNECIVENGSFEAIACRIDFMKLDKGTLNES